MISYTTKALPPGGSVPNGRGFISYQGQQNRAQGYVCSCSAGVAAGLSWHAAAPQCAGLGVVGSSPLRFADTLRPGGRAARSRSPWRTCRAAWAGCRPQFSSGCFSNSIPAVVPHCSLWEREPKGHVPCHSLVDGAVGGEEAVASSVQDGAAGPLLLQQWWVGARSMRCSQRHGEHVRLSACTSAHVCSLQKPRS